MKLRLVYWYRFLRCEWRRARREGGGGGGCRERVWTSYMRGGVVGWLVAEGAFFSFFLLIGWTFCSAGNFCRCCCSVVVGW